MAINIKHDLNTRSELLAKSIEEIEKKIKTLPEGRINIRHQNKRSYYYLFGVDSTEKYLDSGDRELIEKLIQKDYLKRVLKDVKRELCVYNSNTIIKPKQNLKLIQAIQTPILKLTLI